MIHSPNALREPPSIVTNGYARGVQCKATNRAGERCKRIAMSGQAVCRTHGGASPQAKAKARERLQSLVDPAVQHLETILNDSVAIKDYQSALRAITAILDRTGYHAKSVVELEGELSHDHTGEIVHRHQLLDPDRLPLILRRMMAASIESDWTPSEELEMAIRAELPMLQVKVESSKEVKK